MKVDRDHTAAALHQAETRHWRIDAPGQQRHDAPAHAGRHPTRPGLLPEVVKRLAGERFDVDRELRIVEIDCPAFRFLDSPPDFTFDLWGREREPLVGTSCRHSERGDAQIAEIREDGVRDAVDVEWNQGRTREIGDAEHAAQAVGHRLPRIRATEDDLDAPHLRDHALHVQVARCRFDVPHQPRDEPGAVSPLQRNFLVMDDDRIHERASAARRPLMAAPSIVAGRPVSIQSPASTRPLTPVTVAGRFG